MVKERGWARSLLAAEVNRGVITPGAHALDTPTVEHARTEIARLRA